MQNNPKTRTKTLPIVIAICATLVLLAAVGGWIYNHQQDIAQHDRELSQQKQLKEEELKEQKAAADEQADATRDAARCTTQSKSSSTLGLLGC